MDQNTKQLIEGLKNNKNAVQSIMQSKDGQELLQRLSAKDGGQGLQKATLSAAKGDTAALAQMVGQLMNSPEGAALVERINATVRK